METLTRPRYGGSTCISGLKLPLSVAQTTPTPVADGTGSGGVQISLDST